MFSDEIKQQTKPAHQSTEKAIIAQIKGVRNVKDYARLLHFFYGFYHPLEEQLDVYFRQGEMAGFAHRRKSSLLLQDLAQLGEEKADSASPFLPAIKSLPQAIGAFYVLEGSTLGGVIIAGMLSKQAAIPATQLQFFTGYGDKTMENWSAFTQFMNRYVAGTGSGEEIVHAAQDTFTCFEQWAAAYFG